VVDLGSMETFIQRPDWRVSTPYRAPASEASEPISKRNKGGRSPPYPSRRSRAGNTLKWKCEEDTPLVENEDASWIVEIF
jgi:hypothetical protein